MSVQHLERRIGLVLAVATFAGAGLVGLGVVAMIAAGIDPLTRPYPGFDASRLGSDLAAGRPEGVLWLGLVAVILTPVIRVGASLVGFAAANDRRQAAIALVVLVVLALSVFLGRGA